MTNPKPAKIPDRTQSDRGGHDRSASRRLSFSIAFFSLLGALACFWAAGTTLGLFIGGFFVVTFFAPAGDRRSYSLVFLQAAIPVALVWLIALFKTPDTFGQWAQISAALIVYSFALAAMNRSVGYPLTIILALAWLTWPVWLTSVLPNISTHTVNLLVAVHPPLVANGVLRSEPPWTEQAIAYRMTRLDQDIPIHLPTQAAPCVLFHLLVAVCFVTPGILRRRLHNR